MFAVVGAPTQDTKFFKYFCFIENSSFIIMSKKVTSVNVAPGCDFIHRGCKCFGRVPDIFASLSDESTCRYSSSKAGGKDATNATVHRIARDSKFVRELVSGDKRLKDFTESTLSQKLDEIPLLELPQLLSIRLNQDSCGLDKVRSYLNTVDNFISIHTVELFLDRNEKVFTNGFNPPKKSIDSSDGRDMRILFQEDFQRSSSRGDRIRDLKRMLGKMILQTLGLVEICDGQQINKQRKPNEDDSPTSSNKDKTKLSLDWWKLTILVPQDLCEIEQPKDLKVIPTSNKTSNDVPQIGTFNISPLDPKPPCPKSDSRPSSSQESRGRIPSGDPSMKSVNRHTSLFRPRGQFTRREKFNISK